MKALLFSTLMSALLLAACNSAEQGPPPAALVVYAAEQQEARLAEAFSAFTSETRIPVELKVADDAANVRSVTENTGMPAADVLITSSVIDIWKAAEEGALRPLTASRFDTVPADLKDPDRAWVALAVRDALIVTSQGADTHAVSDYGDLAKAELRGKLCLSSSGLAVNRSLIAMLIEDIGLKPAERMVRGWMRNLAASPYRTEQQLADAVRSGACQFAIVSSSLDLDGLTRISPAPLYRDIDGIGVARHANQPAAAQSLVQWMLTNYAVPEAESSNGRNLGLAGWRDEDVRLLAERAAYR